MPSESTYGPAMPGRLDEFLRARAADLDDETHAEVLRDLADELYEIDSDMTVSLALLEAARFSDHQDYRDEWRI